MIELTLIFLVITFINVLPAFAPPTWTVLAYFEVARDPNSLLLALVGAAAATLGRALLARFASSIIRARFLSSRVQKNLDTVKERLGRDKEAMAGGILLFAFAPLPSNQLFLAYGLTDLPIKNALVPFFGGRFFSYLFWILTAGTLAEYLPEKFMGYMLGPYFIATQLFTLFAVWLFARLDWNMLLEHKKLHLIKE
jgi:hypothetical protein